MQFGGSAFDKLHARIEEVDLSTFERTGRTTVVDHSGLTRLGLWELPPPFPPDRIVARARWLCSVEQSLTYHQIAERLHIGVTTAYEAYQRALRDLVPQEKANEARATALEELQMYKREALRIMRTEHFLVEWGKVVMIDGKPARDDGPAIQALNLLAGLERQISAIWGYDAPKSGRSTRSAEDAWATTMQDLERELGIEPGAPIPAYDEDQIRTESPK